MIITSTRQDFGTGTYTLVQIGEKQNEEIMELRGQYSMKPSSQKTPWPSESPFWVLNQKQGSHSTLLSNLGFLILGIHQ